MKKLVLLALLFLSGSCPSIPTLHADETDMQTETVSSAETIISELHKAVEGLEKLK